MTSWTTYSLEGVILAERLDALVQVLDDHGVLQGPESPRRDGVCGCRVGITLVLACGSHRGNIDEEPSCPGAALPPCRDEDELQGVPNAWLSPVQ